MNNILYRRMMVNILNIQKYTTQFMYPQFIVRQKNPTSYTQTDYNDDRQKINILLKHPYVIEKMIQTKDQPK